MRRGTAPVIFFIPVILNCVSLAASSETSGRQADLLPWQLIAEKVQQKNEFCSREVLDRRPASCGPKKPGYGLAPNKSYAYQPNQAIDNIEPPDGKVVTRSHGKIGVSLAKYVGNSWQHIAEIDASIESNRIRLTEGIKEEGLLRLRFALEAEAERSSNSETYAIISDNWKVDSLAFCRKWKEQIEANPDSKLMFSSIAVSHFNHVMEMVSQSSFLSGQILGALADAVQSKRAFDEGECPDLVIGLNKIRLRRFEGSKIAEFVVFVPESYDGSRKWPVYLHPDGKRFYAAGNYRYQSGLIDIWWHFTHPFEFRGRQYKYSRSLETLWKDYKYFLDCLKTKLNLDEDRFYLYGHCGNGVLTMALALNHPDQWGECGTHGGSSYNRLAGNALNLLMILTTNPYERGVAVTWTSFAANCFRYWGCRDFKYNEGGEVAQTRGSPIPEAARAVSPQRVLYTIESLQNSKAYWVTILGRKDENLPATMDASASLQTIVLKTNNVDAYALDLVQAPVDANQPVEIVENGRSLGSVREKTFISSPEAYTIATHVKNERLHGPVSDAFSDPYVVVYGTGGANNALLDASRKVGLLLSNGAPCFPDTNMPKEFVNTHNLVLVSGPNSNLWFSRLRGDLPLQITTNAIIAGNNRYEGRDTGCIFIHPNPINPDKYVVVFAGTSATSMTKTFDAYLQMRATRPADVGVFDITEEETIRWRLCEKFSTLWNWHEGWNKVLAATRKQHPKRQWCQWIVSVVRKQLKADVALLGDPFEFSELFRGPVTHRDLFTNLRNDWIIKVSLKGAKLRDFLFGTSVGELNPVSEEVTSTPFICGVSLTKPKVNHDEILLRVGDLESDKYYEAALSCQYLNGQTMITELRPNDYEILGEGYLVQLIREYLCTERDLDLDSKLENLELLTF